MKSKIMSKGFTLLELIIVIGILAVLGAVSVLVLNPAQLFAQARDSQRISDLASVQAAIGLYLSTATSPAIAAAGPFCTVGALTVFSDACTTRDLYGVDNTGWVAINLGGTQGGSPLSTLPKDPTNDSTYFYAFKGDTTNLTFELNGRLESTKFRDKMTTDGGNKNTCGTDYGTTVTTRDTCYYEVGTEPGLAL